LGEKLTRINKHLSGENVNFSVLHIEAGNICYRALGYAGNDDVIFIDTTSLLGVLFPLFIIILIFSGSVCIVIEVLFIVLNVME